jgi:GDP-L-fucose synthase
MINKITKKSKIFVAGHKGLVGSSIIRRLKFFGYKKIITKSKKDLDLRNQNDVNIFFKKNKPDAVINAAATVGGIYANNEYRAEFIFNNISIQTNIIHASYKNKVKQLIFLGSSCVYPKICKQPIKEEYLLDGKLEKTNEPYAIAKIAGIKMCESYNDQYKTNFKCLMPCNTYGPNDNYNLLTSHFYPALISKIHFAKVNNKKNITIWGNGKTLRELIYVDDVADACIFFMNKKTKDSLINIGTGKDMSIKDYTKFILRKLDLKIKIKFNKSIPDGIYRKLLNVSKAKKYGWKAKTSLDMGFDIAYESFIKGFKHLK